MATQHAAVTRKASISARPLRLIDGPMAPLPCLSRTSYRRCVDCDDEAGYRIRRVFGAGYRATLDVLERTSVADAIEAKIKLDTPSS